MVTPEKSDSQPKSFRDKYILINCDPVRLVPQMMRGRDLLRFDGGSRVRMWSIALAQARSATERESVRHWRKHGREESGASGDRAARGARDRDPWGIRATAATEGCGVHLGRQDPAGAGAAVWTAHSGIASSTRSRAQTPAARSRGRFFLCADLAPLNKVGPHEHEFGLNSQRSRPRRPCMIDRCASGRAFVWSGCGKRMHSMGQVSLWVPGPRLVPRRTGI